MRRKMQAAVAERPLVTTECHHHWVIDGASGPSSRGICKLCGAQRKFDNAGPDHRRDGVVSALLNLPVLRSSGAEHEADN